MHLLSGELKINDGPCVCFALLDNLHHILSKPKAVHTDRASIWAALCIVLTLSSNVSFLSMRHGLFIKDRLGGGIFLIYSKVFYNEKVQWCCSLLASADVLSHTPPVVSADLTFCWHQIYLNSGSIFFQAELINIWSDQPWQSCDAAAQGFPAYASHTVWYSGVYTQCWIPRRTISTHHLCSTQNTLPLP